MGILDWFRGRPKEHSLPEPTPVAPEKKTIPSDLPPIRPEYEPVEKHEIITYSEPPVQKLPPHEVVEKPRYIPEHSSELPDVAHIFVSSDEYSTVVVKTNEIRSKLLETSDRIDKLAKLRASEEKHLKQWEEQLAGLEAKFSYMEKVLEKSSEV